MLDTILITLFIIVCVLLIIVVLLQKGRGGGLGAAFGGMGSSAFGTRVGDVFTWVTVVMTGLFLLLAITTSLALRPPTGTVVRPVFVPAPGNYGAEKTVTMRCQTVGAAIYFTMDGTEPTEKSTVYRKAVRVPPGTMLKAKAFRRGWNASETAVGFYGAAAPKDETPPAGAPAGAPVGKPEVKPETPPAPAPAPASAPAG